MAWRGCGPCAWVTCCGTCSWRDFAAAAAASVLALRCVGPFPRAVGLRQPAWSTAPASRWPGWGAGRAGRWLCGQPMARCTPRKRSACRGSAGLRQPAGPGRWCMTLLWAPLLAAPGVAGSWCPPLSWRGDACCLRDASVMTSGCQAPLVLNTSFAGRCQNLRVVVHQQHPDALRFTRKTLTPCLQPEEGISTFYMPQEGP